MVRPKRFQSFENQKLPAGSQQHEPRRDQSVSEASTECAQPELGVECEWLSPGTSEVRRLRVGTFADNIPTKNFLTISWRQFPFATMILGMILLLSPLPPPNSSAFICVHLWLNGILPIIFLFIFSGLPA